MAFNLENKITWKELSPSLQSMFKALQTQVTNNKNEINTINNTITQIQGHLTQIDNSITQINNNINEIKGDIVEINNKIESNYNELKQYIDNTKIEIIEEAGELDFLNVAPKIGYYQDDTIEVISKYNMNNPSAYGQTSNPVVTVDKFGRTIEYFLANDGSYDTNGKYQLYYGYGEGNAVMTFVNEPLTISGATNNLVTGILSCDNDWIVLQYNGRWYIYDTNYDTDPSKWTNRKDITSIITSTDSIGFKFIRKYGTIVICYKSSNDLTAQNWAKLKIYRYSDLKLLNQYDLENFSHYVIIDGNRSFDLNGNNTRLSNTGNITTSYSSWHSSSFIINDDQELISIVNRGLCFTYYNKSGGNRSFITSGYYHIAYHVDRSIFMGNTGTIKTLTKDHNVMNIGPILSFMTNTGNGSHYVVSYNSLSNITYTCCNQRDVFRFYYSIIDNSIQNTDNTEYLGIYNTTTVAPSICWPADASLWGKWIKWGYSMWDMMCFYAVSKNGENLISVKQFQKYNGHDNIIEPRPGYYSKTTVPSDPNATRPFWVYNWGGSGNPKGFTSTKMTDGSPQYWTVVGSSSGGKMKLYKWIRTSDSSLNDEAFTVSTQYNSNLDIDIGTTAYWNSVLFNNNSSSVTFSGIYYNPIGDYIVLFCRDNHAYYSDSNPSNPSWGNRLYMGIVKRNGTKLGWGYTNNSKYGAMGTFIESLSNTVFNSKQTFTYRHQTACCPSKTEIIVVIDYYKNGDGGYTNRQYRIKFNDAITDFSVQEIPSIDYSYKTNVNESPSIYYSGPKYGFMVCGNGWTKFPQLWRTQKPLISGTGKTYTDEEFLSSYKSNSNSYYMYLQSSQGLIAYIPNIPIFLGGYFSVIENPIGVTLQPNCDNYVYLERDTEDRDNIIATATTVKTIDEGDRVFSKILLAKITTNSSNMIAVEYYRINIGYNDYLFNWRPQVNGSKGQLITVGDNNYMRADNNFRTLRVVDNDSDFNKEKANVSTTKEIFNSWSKYNSYNNQQCIKYLGGPDGNYPSNDGQNNASNGDRNTFWSYDASSDTIKMPHNRNTYDIFVSSDSYLDYEIEFLVYRIDGDDDNFCIVLGYEQLQNNKYNYIILNRSNCFQNGTTGAQSIAKSNVYWSIIYNMFTDENMILSDHSSMLYNRNNKSCIANNSRKYCKMKVKKTGRTFECITSANCNSEAECTYLDSTKFTYTVPSTKPSNWTQSQWNAIDTMVSYSSRIGVGVESQPCTFKLLNSQLIQNNIIYRIDTEQIFVYENGWKEDTSRRFDDEIPPHSWVYNAKTGKLFHYDGNRNYTYINH